MVSILWVVVPIIIIAILLAVIWGVKSDNKLIPSIVLAAVGIILIGSLLVPALDEMDREAPRGWQYDDYQKCSSDCVASGALEVVSLGGTYYVHASDIGDGSYTDYGKTHDVTVSKADLDVYMLAGQSNAAYAFYDSDAASPRPLPGTAYYYGTSTTPAQSWNGTTDDYGIYSMVDSDGDMYIGNIEAPFAATYYERTGNKVLIVNTAISGTKIGLFVPGQSGYTYMEDCWTDALSKIDTDHFNVLIKSYLWIQGESDSATAVNAYCGSFVSMNEALTDPDGNFKLKSAIISQVRSASSANAAEAQAYLTSVWPGIYMGTEIAQTFTVANGLLRDDDLHYTQAGYNKVGVALANFAASHGL